MAKKKNKFNAKKIVEDGITFDSLAEHKRYKELKRKNLKGEILNLRVHVRYRLFDKSTVYVNDGYETLNKCDYVADFVYEDLEGRTHVEDVKGCTKGAAYQHFQTKKKYMYDKYKLFVEEIKE